MSDLSADATPTPSDQDDIRQKLDSILHKSKTSTPTARHPGRGLGYGSRCRAVLSTSEKTIRRLVLAVKLKSFRPIGGVIVLHREEIDRGSSRRRPDADQLAVERRAQSMARRAPPRVRRCRSATKGTLRAHLEILQWLAPQPKSSTLGSLASAAPA